MADIVAASRDAFYRDLRGRILSWYRENPITPEVRRIVNSAAWRISSRIPDGATARAEIEQKLLLAVCRAADSWDPKRGAYLSWIRGAIELQTRRIIERLKCRSDEWAHRVWLDAQDYDASLDVIDLLRVDGVYRMVSAMDFRSFRETLGPRDRAIVDLVTIGYSLSEIMRIFGIPRSTFYASVWANIVSTARRFFHD